jgi:hypothetical protein
MFAADMPSLEGLRHATLAETRKLFIVRSLPASTITYKLTTVHTEIIPLQRRIDQCVNAIATEIPYPLPRGASF